MYEYDFSPANYEDIPDVVSLYQSLVDTPGCTWDFDYPSQATAQFELANGWLYVLTQGEQIVAAASVGEFGELGDLCWSPLHPCELARVRFDMDFYRYEIKF